jgi:hypothetical protein
VWTSILGVINDVCVGRFLSFTRLAVNRSGKDDLKFSLAANSAM